MIADGIARPRSVLFINWLQASDSTLPRVVVRRILHAIPVLLGVTFLTFSLLNLLPGSVALAIVGDGATQEQIDAVTQRLHLDRPFLVQYFDWLHHAVLGNFGASLQSDLLDTSLTVVSNQMQTATGGGQIVCGRQRGFNVQLQGSHTDVVNSEHRQKLADHRPSAGHWAWEHTLFSEWQHLPHLYPQEREAMQKRLREIEEAGKGEEG